jgi:hypothetical protein
LSLDKKDLKLGLLAQSNWKINRIKAKDWKF